MFNKAKTNGINIKPLTRMDRISINEFYSKLSTESLNYYDVKQTSQVNLLNSLSGAQSQKRNYAAFVDGEIAGIAVMWDYDKAVPWFSIVVADHLQGRGVGRRLLEFCLQSARNDQKGGVLLTTHITNIRAQSLYVHCGFERLGVHLTGEELYLRRF